MLTFSKTIETIDSHTEGNPTRVIVAGVPIPEGETLWDKKCRMESEYDQIRKLVNFEPRGGGLMCSVLLMPPLIEQADFSILIMEQEGYVPMSGHCAIGTAMTVVSNGMVPMQEPITKVRLHTLAGLVEAQVRVENNEVIDVTITNVESFLLMQDQRLKVEGLGDLKIDLGYGGDFYPIINADQIDLILDAAHEREIVAVAKKIRSAVADQLSVQHPEKSEIDQCYQVQFISEKTTNGGDIRNTVVAPPGAMDRSPCGTGTSLLTARALAKGIVQIGNEYKVEGPLGTFFIGKAVSQETRKGINYVVPQFTGRAFITGFNKIVLSEHDPFPDGFQIGV